MRLNYNYSTRQEDLQMGAVLHLGHVSGKFIAIVIEEGPKRKIFIDTNDIYSVSRFKIDFFDKTVILLTDEGEEQEGVWSHLDLINVINKYEWEILIKK